MFWDASKCPLTLNREDPYSKWSSRSNHYSSAYTTHNGVQHKVYTNVWSRSGVTQSGAELLQSGRELTTKVGEQPWPQLMCCALICCRMCSCIFQEDRIVVRSAGEEWYID